jgi:hypothetical protein
MRLALVGIMFLVADHFFFEGRHREAAWHELKLVGARLNAQIAGFSGGN